DLGFALDRHYVDPPLSRVTTIPTLLLPPQLTLDLNNHPVRLAILQPRSASAFHTPSSAFLTPPLALPTPRALGATSLIFLVRNSNWMSYGVYSSYYTLYRVAGSASTTWR
ncbi:uncharacterized protein N7518_004623, partial [Penicillium psychrosexuale]|uniref:uncharacterized protein n=1 Tax=Penicillium psychrosexuale TaxID=1002107 RepID=UPI0025457656